ncbi:redoxin domain-containing protein [Daejeonella sp.]|jgi:peroxiredoxin|uniref:redoxin domain-containing protein n=1 Tax=Daejeonella sp. TaxID=2805397 RepID=UPI003783ED99
MRFSPIILSFFLLINPIIVFAQKTYTLTGTVAKEEIDVLYLTKSNFFQAASSSKAEKIAVVNGKFSISGPITEPIPVFISLSEDYQKDGIQSKQFVLDQGIIRIDIKANLSDATVVGSKAHDDIIRYNLEQTPYSDSLNAVNQEAQRVSMSGLPADSVRSMFRKPFRNATNALTDFQKNFVKNNPSSYISLLIIPNIVSATSNFVEAEELLNALDDNVESTSTAVGLREYIAGQKKTSIGSIAPEFAMADSAGTKIDLSSLRGKYVLLDFWAAWCGPCRQENPNVVNAFKMHKNSGFTVFGVSLDRDRKSWLKAIKDDQLDWQHVSDLKYWANEAALLYGISSIPRNFLLGPDGKIIARDLRGQDLQDKLKEIFPLKK